MKKLLCIFILTASVSIIFVLLDSCKKDSPCHYIPIESSCEINSKETKFNYCFNGTNMLSENPVFYDLKEVGSNWNDENINISMIFLHRDGMSDYYFPIKIMTYTLDDIAVSIFYPHLDSKFIASKDINGTSLKFTINSVHDYCENENGKYFSISGTYSIIAIEDTELNPDTLRITNGVFEKLNKFQNK